MVKISLLLDGMRDTCEQGIYLLMFVVKLSFLTKFNRPNGKFHLPDFVRSFLLAVTIAGLIVVAQLLVMLASIRRNMIQSFRGDSHEAPRRTPAMYIL